MGRKSGGGHSSHHGGHGGHGGHHGQQHSNDQYVTGDTHWESYELPQLIAMVNDKVDIPALIRLADDWRYAGEDMTTSARELARALDTLMDFWSGDAAEEARTNVALNAQWVSDLGMTAHQIGDPVEEAAGALKAAQDQMPQLLAYPQVAGSAPLGARTGAEAGGPLGAAIGGVNSATESAAEQQAAEARLKQQAVETMRRFETAAMSIDQSIPQFEGPDTVIHPEPGKRPGHLGPPVPPPVTVVVGSETTVSWQQLTGAHNANTAAANAGGGHAGGGGFGGVGVPQHGLPVGAGAGGGAGVGRLPAPATGSVSGVTPPPLERVGFGTLPAGAMPEVEGHPGMAGAGAPMGAGMGAGAGAGTGNDHRRRFPFEEDDPFSPDQKASPPVIGL